MNPVELILNECDVIINDRLQKETERLDGLTKKFIEFYDKFFTLSFEDGVSFLKENFVIKNYDHNINAVTFFLLYKKGFSKKEIYSCDETKYINYQFEGTQICLKETLQHLTTFKTTEIKPNKFFKTWFESRQNHYSTWLKSKLSLSLNKHFQADDIVLSTIIFDSKKGFTISTKFTRGNEDYCLTTDCISAGGYNIQRYHYRYISNLTKL